MFVSSSKKGEKGRKKVHLKSAPHAPRPSLTSLWIRHFPILCLLIKCLVYLFRISANLHWTWLKWKNSPGIQIAGIDLIVFLIWCSHRRFDEGREKLIFEEKRFFLIIAVGRGEVLLFSDWSVKAFTFVDALELSTLHRLFYGYDEISEAST